MADSEVAEEAGDDHIVTVLQTWKTELVLAVRSEQDPGLKRWLDTVLREEVADVEYRASRFRADSEVSMVNAGAGSWVETSWDFVTVLTASLEAAAATEGLVDPLMGTHLVAAGYDTWAGEESIIDAGTGSARWQDIEVRPGGRQAQVRIPAGSALDLGAVTKGWLADRLATTVHTSTGLDVLANMGGDLRVISPGEPWTVAADPDMPGIDQLDLDIENAGLATSGISHRAWDSGHHIIDPRTGEPAITCWRSVSVIAAEAAGANAASTAALILSDGGPQWLAGMGLDGWFVGAPGEPAGAPVQRAVGALQQLLEQAGTEA